MTQQSAYLASKPRYEILDGLRGVAALLVIGYHLFETYFHGAPDQPINHGYLAVDFFFCLSGFVIGYAYDDRWDRMSTWNFFKRRLVRLHPMIIAGTALAVLLFYFSDWSEMPLVNQVPCWQVLGMMVLGMLMIPVTPAMDVRGWQEFYPLNGPQWSLMWEYLANILYALIIRHFPKWLLMLFVAVSALLTLNLALDIDVTGVLTARDYAKYTVVGGWSATPDQELIGITRLLYPFFCGLLISRFNSTSFNLQSSFFNVKGGFWWTSLIIVAVLCWPHLNGQENALEDGIYQAFCILIVFPLVVSMGAGSTVSGRSANVCTWLGKISYPVYITHYAFMYMQMSWAEKHQDLPTSTHVFVAICLLIISVLTAQAILTLYDEPVREWLKEHWLKRGNKKS